MKICSQCQSNFWPYITSVSISGFIAFLTWLMLGYGEFDATEQMLGAIGMFLAVGGIIIHYMMACIERHCHHSEQEHLRRTRRFGPRNRPLGV